MVCNIAINKTNKNGRKMVSIPKHNTIHTYQMNDIIIYINSMNVILTKKIIYNVLYNSCTV